MRKIRIAPRIAAGDLLWAIPASVAAFAALSVWLGPDASWDLRNYHIYNAFAALTGRLQFDLAPAQLQTFHAPLLDIGEQWLRWTLNAHPALLDALLAIPQAAAAVLAFRVGLLVLPAGRLFRTGLALLAAIAGATGVAGVSTLGTSMSEALPVCCLLLGLVLLLGAAPGIGGLPGRALAVGALAGAAVGLKLTQAPGALGLFAALIVCAVRPRRAEAACTLTTFALGAIAAAFLFAGWWWWRLWQLTGNPLFPYFNDIFRSPWGAAARMSDARFLPHNLSQALFYPLYWTFDAQTLVTELPSRDPRIALGWAAVVAICLHAALKRAWPAPPVAALAVFWMTTYVTWEWQFSVLRYTFGLELLSFVLVLAAIADWLSADGRGKTQWKELLVFAVVAGLTMAATLYPRWARVTPGPLAFDVRPPNFGPGSLVVLLDPAPMAYVAGFVRADTRFVGANSNLVRPGAPGILSDRIAAVIGGQTSPIWGLEEPIDQPGAADATLRFYGLRRGRGCARIRSNLDDNAILACPLIRDRMTARPAP